MKGAQGVSGFGFRVLGKIPREIVGLGFRV